MLTISLSSDGKVWHWYVMRGDTLLRADTCHFREEAFAAACVWIDANKP